MGTLSRPPCDHDLSSLRTTKTNRRDNKVEHPNESYGSKIQLTYMVQEDTIRERDDILRSTPQHDWEGNFEYLSIGEVNLHRWAAKYGFVNDFL